MLYMIILSLYFGMSTNECIFQTNWTNVLWGLELCISNISVALNLQMYAFVALYIYNDYRKDSSMGNITNLYF